ncbi:hypothetical protein MtrunA17_Chr5g0402731 [Medicago truncatula]|uniref:Uncharacterized protein n=1 Tax=Medicago truncatula TaxID=3880 RepID=A0A396HRR4_MEDTR|nr:hypothetical protein MtrunA17_Chr5g0402731 [Medicago truncatula]
MINRKTYVLQHCLEVQHEFKLLFLRETTLTNEFHEANLSYSRL